MTAARALVPILLFSKKAHKPGYRVVDTLSTTKRLKTRFRAPKSEREGGVS
jgi:hypothetical protein